MKIHVLGCGETIAEFYDEGITIGVNDIWQYYATDYLVVVNKPGDFDYDRLEIIKNSKPKKFYSQLMEWEFMPNFEKIELRSDRKIEAGEKYCISHISPFVAVQIAARLGAKEIIMWGVDMNSHMHLQYKVDKIIEDFRLLKNMLEDEGVSLKVGNYGSRFSKILPVYGEAPLVAGKKQTYDIVVVINTFERPEMLSELLQDIKLYSKDLNIKVKVYDDCSTKNYTQVTKYLKENFSNVYFRFAENHGKVNYWKLNDFIFKGLKHESFRYVIQLPDDVRLKPDFFHRAIRYKESLNEKCNVLNLVICEVHRNYMRWGVIPEKVTVEGVEFIISNWVDMLYIADRKFFEMLNFEIKRIEQNKFLRPISTSNVGRQISKRIVDKSGTIYQLWESLATSGDHKSVMNPQLREIEKMISL